jgi:hypothetical protein
VKIDDCRLCSRFRGRLGRHFEEVHVADVGYEAHHSKDRDHGQSEHDQHLAATLIQAIFFQSHGNSPTGRNSSRTALSAYRELIETEVGGSNQY